MSDRPTDELAAKLEETLKLGITDDGMKAIKKKVDDILYDIETDVMYRLKDDLAPNLSAYVADMAQRTVNAILEGRDDEMRRYLSCKEGYWSGRDTDHPVIHGTLFETGALKLRRDIAMAHRDLIGSERILDLEAQVASLVIQVNKLTAEREQLRERCRGAL